jgi:hypothetical protein
MKKGLLIGAMTLVIALSVVAYAAAASQTIVGQPRPSDGKYEATGHVLVNATVNPKVELSLSEDVMDAGVLDPDTAPSWSGSVTVGTKSNVLCTLSASVGGTVNGAGRPTFTSSLASGGPLTDLRGVTTRNDAYEMTVDYNVNPGSYQADVTYTLVQQ